MVRPLSPADNQLDLRVEGRPASGRRVSVLSFQSAEQEPDHQNKIDSPSKHGGIELKHVLKIGQQLEGYGSDEPQIASDEGSDGEKSWGERENHPPAMQAAEDAADMLVQGVGQSRPTTAKSRGSNREHGGVDAKRYHRYNPSPEVRDMLRRKSSTDSGMAGNLNLNQDDRKFFTMTATPLVSALPTTSMLDISLDREERPKPYIGKLWTVKYGPQKSAEAPTVEPKLKRVGVSRPTSASVDSLQSMTRKAKRPASSVVSRRLAVISPLVHSTRANSQHLPDEGLTSPSDRLHSAEPMRSQTVSSNPLSELQEARERARSGLPLRSKPRIPAQDMAAKVPLPASSADVSYQLQETFASEEVGGTRGSVEDWDGFPLPPNHKAREVFDKERRVLEVQLVPERRPAGRRDAQTASRWIQAEWKRFR